MTRPFRLIPGGEEKPKVELLPEDDDEPTSEDASRLPVRRPEDAPPLPVPDEDGEVEQYVYEGEVVDEPQAPPIRMLPVPVRGKVIAVRPSPGTVKAARVTAHMAFTAGQGWHSWNVRAWDGLTLGVYRRAIRQAEAIGDREALAEWVDRMERAKHQRHDRLMELPILAVNIAKTLGISIIGALMLLLALSTAVWATGVGDFPTVWHIAGNVIRFLLTLVKWLWPVLPVALVVAAFREGQRRGTPVPWLMPREQRAADNVQITPSLVVTAMRDLGIATLRKAVQEMGDAGAGMLGLIRIAGCGVEVDVTLPSGVSTEEVQKRRRKLAENLGRHEYEVFITIPAARTVRLWIADSGALDEPIGPSPLVTDPDMKADYKSGQAPWGQDLRGDAAMISLFQRHLLITGLSNQGKTASMRALALWLALDPRVEFRIADLKGVGDWAMFEDLATVLIQGPTDEHVIAATEMLENGLAEMERRLQAPAGTKFDPLILIVDEAQVAFMCPAREEYMTDDGKVKLGAPYGGSKSTSRYYMAARKIQNQGRAVDVLLWEGTQNPTDQNLPVLVREGAHIRASLAVGTESQSRMALGDKAVDGGASPHLLRQGLDKGTVVSNGEGLTVPAGQSSITIRTHYVSNEEAAEVANRAKARRKKVTTRTSMEPEEDRDLLTDLDGVLGEERTRLSDLVSLLRDLAPRWRPYQGLTGAELANILKREHGVRVTNTGNILRLDPADLRRVLAQRQAGE